MNINQNDLNNYKKLVLNTSEEIPYSRIKNTIFCTEAIKINKNNMNKYQQNDSMNILNNNLTNHNNNQKSLKVVYHDKYFKENINKITYYEELVSILNNEQLITLNNLNYIKEPFINSNKIIFDSNFESGNLHMSIELEELLEYDLIIRPEFGTNKVYQWFFFSVYIPKNDSYITNKILKFNIINLPKDKSQFNSQCPVLIYDTSLKKWSRNTFNVFIYNNGIKNEKLKNEYLAYFTLTFSFNFEYNTKYYFAYSYPYTYTQLKLYLNTLNKDMYKNIIKFGKVGLTLNKNDIPYIVITNFNSNINEIKKRKCVFLTSRIHPGETSSSYVIQGVINFLINIKNKISIFLRNKYIFKIIPMINIDGVIYGNYRTNIKGRDLNRMWVEPNENHSICVLNIKKLIKFTLLHREIEFYCDFHGHSNKSNCFLYGCEKKGVANIEKIFMKILQKNNNTFDINSCVNKINQSKIKTGRAILKNEFKIDLSYCLESSMISYTNPINSKKYFPFNIEKYKKIGFDFCLSLNELFDSNNFNKLLNELNTFNNFLNITHQINLNNENNNNNNNNQNNNKSNNNICI